MDNLVYVGNVGQPTTNPVDIAIETIEKQSRKIAWECKEKWMKFTGGDIAFLKAVRSKLAAQQRQAYGNSRPLQATVVVENDVPTLYIHSER